MTPDVNVLVATARADHPHHAQAHAWLTQAIAPARGKTGLRVMSMVVSGFLRVMTHPKTFKPPTPTASAAAFLDALLALPGVALMPVQGEWPQLRSLCLDKTLSGNAIPDAWIAACVLQHGETLATFDRDFTQLLPAKNLLLLQH